MRTAQSQYRSAQLREMASLGCTASQAAALLGVTRQCVYHHNFAEGLNFRRVGKFSKPWHQQLRDGFARGLSPKQLSELTSRPKSTVIVTLCKMGLTANRRRDPGKYKRPYDIPDELFGRYKELRQLGLTYEEIGYDLGLLARAA